MFGAARIVSLIAAAAVLAATIVYLVEADVFGGAGLLGNPIERELEGEKRTGPRQSSHPPRRAASPPVGANPADPSGTAIPALVSILEAVWALIRLSAVVTLAALTIVAIRRGLARRRRRFARAVVVPDVSDRSSSLDLRKFYESLHGLNQVRWWERIWRGQHSFSLELVQARAAGGLHQQLQIGFRATPGQLLGKAMVASLEQRYENVRTGGRPMVLRGGTVIRLRKRFGVLKRVGTPDISEGDAGDRQGRGTEFIDVLLAVLEKVDSPVWVQWVCTPTPRIYERVVRAVARGREDQLNRDSIHHNEAGPRSTVTREELEGSAEGVVWQASCWTDIRVISPDAEAARTVAAALVGSGRAENQLEQKYLRLRRGVVLRRARSGEGAPLPNPARDAFSSSELAGMWRLPEPSKLEPRMHTHRLPRKPPARDVHRVAATEGLLQASADGHLSLHERDLEGNLAIVGLQGSGKTSMLVRAATMFARDPNAALFLPEPKGDGWEAFITELGGAAERLGKKLWVLDFANPLVGLDPLGSRLMTPQERAEALVGALSEMLRLEDGSTQIMRASEGYIVNMCQAALEVLEQPTMSDITDLLSVTEAGVAARAHVSQLLGARPDLGFLKTEIDESIAQLKKSEAAFVQRFGAPRNKVSMLTEPRVDAIFRHPFQLDLAEIIRNRDILVVAGARHNFGMQRSDGLMILMLSMIYRAVVKQQDLPPSERAKVGFVMDEAHRVFSSEELTQALAMARSAGLRSVLAWQSMDQIPRDKQQELLSLLGSVSVFRCGQQEARTFADLMQRVHQDSYRADAASVADRTIDPANLTYLPHHHCISSWMVNGARSRPFVARTYPMCVEPEVVEETISRMLVRGARPVDQRDFLLPKRDWRRIATDEEFDSGGDDKVPGAPPPPSDRSAGNKVAAKIAREKRRPGGADLPRAAARGSEGARRDPDAEVAPQPETAEPESARASSPPVPKDSGNGSPTRPASHGRRRRPPSAETAEVEGLPHWEPAGPPPDSYTYLERFDAIKSLGPIEELEAASPRSVRGGTWDLVEGGFEPDAEELSILHKLWCFAALTPEMIGRLALPSVTDRTVRRKLQSLYEAGLIKRFQINIETGRGPRVWRLTRAGFEMCKLKARSGRRSKDHVELGAEWREDELDVLLGGPRLEDDKWSDSEVSAPAYLIHDLRCAAWVGAFSSYADPMIRRIRGKGQSWMAPPFRRDKRSGKKTKLGQADVKLDGGIRLEGLGFEWRTVRPDASLEIVFDNSRGREVHTQLCVEFERDRFARERHKDKLRAYDAFITGWHRLKTPWAGLPGRPETARFPDPPIAIFVLQDWSTARRFAAAADEILSGCRLDAMGNAVYGARMRIFFTAEINAHYAAPRVLRLPAEPPSVRAAKLAQNPAEARKLAATFSPGIEIGWPPRKAISHSVCD